MKCLLVPATALRAVCSLVDRAARLALRMHGCIEVSMTSGQTMSSCRMCLITMSTMPERHADLRVRAIGPAVGKLRRK